MDDDVDAALQQRVPQSGDERSGPREGVEGHVRVVPLGADHDSVDGLARGGKHVGHPARLDACQPTASRAESNHGRTSTSMPNSVWRALR